MPIDPATGYVLASLISAGGAIATNRANARQAEKQMQFQERMSSTAMQRSMADMSAAGINPLFGLNGGGASTPGGASATMVDPVSNALSAGQQAALFGAQVRQARAQAKSAEEQAELAGYQRQVYGQLHAPLFDGDLQTWIRQKWQEELRSPGVNNRAVNARALLDELESQRGGTEATMFGIVNSLLNRFGVNAGGINNILNRVQRK